jgi:hypothetical protein
MKVPLYNHPRISPNEYNELMNDHDVMILATSLHKDMAKIFMDWCNELGMHPQDMIARYIIDGMMHDGEHEDAPLFLRAFGVMHNAIVIIDQKGKFKRPAFSDYYEYPRNYDQE